MYDIASEFIKPKYTNNKISIYFDDKNMIYYVDNFTTIIKKIDFKGASSNLIKIADIDNINNASSLSDKDSSVFKDKILSSNVNLYNIKFKQKDIDVINSIIAMGDNLFFCSSISCNNSMLKITSLDINYMLYYETHIDCKNNFFINLTFEGIYYLSNLLNNTNESIGIYIDEKNNASYISTDTYHIRTSRFHENDLLKKINSIIDKYSNSKNSDTFTKKFCREKYGAKFKHLSKAFDDNISIHGHEKFNIFISNEVKLLLGKEKNK